MGIGGVGMQAAGNLIQKELNPANQVDKAKAEAYLKGFQGKELSPWEKAVTGYDPEAAALRSKEMEMKEQAMADEQAKREKIQQFSDLLGQGKKDEAIAMLASIDPDLWLKTQEEAKIQETVPVMTEEAALAAGNVPKGTIIQKTKDEKEDKPKDIWGYDKSGVVVKIGTIQSGDQLVQLENKENPETESVYSFDEASKKLVKVGDVPKGSKVVVKEAPKPTAAGGNDEGKELLNTQRREALIGASVYGKTNPLTGQISQSGLIPYDLKKNEYVSFAKATPEQRKKFTAQWQAWKNRNKGDKELYSGVLDELVNLGWLQYGTQSSGGGKYKILSVE